MLLVLSAAGAFAQAPKTPALPARAGAPGPGEIIVRALRQEADGPIRRLRGAAEIETPEMILRADEIDYDSSKDYAEARGNVRFDHFARGEHIEADKVEYQLDEQTGRFYEVRGSSPAKLEARPGVLTTTSPFSFQGKWAERIRNRYILHDGFVTSCKLPRPWWVLRSREFDIIPGDRAIARNSTFWLKRVPLLYAPRFYKSLERAPRKSGFLTPNFGNTARRGLMLGGGYYWAINRSYDATYRGQWFRTRGFAHNVDFRAKPAQRTDLNFILYGVNDKGPLLPDGTRGESQGGYLTTLTGRSDLPFGFIARGQFNYLSSFLFRQAFTESFYEAIYSEVHSLGHLSKYWSTYAFHVAASRIETFQWTSAATFPYPVSTDDKLSLRRLPSLEFNSRPRPLSERGLPVYVSWNTSLSFLRRHERALETRQFVDRADIEPRISTALRWKDFHLIPAFSLRETRYGSSLDTEGRLTGRSFTRSSREFTTELILPSLGRVFDRAPGWLGEKVKHVIEPRASFRYVGGIGTGFHRLIRFDETEILSDTREAEFTITNRLFSKLKGGAVHEFLTWDLTQRRYFDPYFGGALLDGRRNVLLSSASLTGYAFLDAPRNYSPLISTLRLAAGPGAVEWRMDYDPVRGHVVNSSLSANGRFRQNYFVSAGHQQVRSVPISASGPQLVGLTPKANQLTGIFGFGQENRRGWSAGAMMVYDYTRDSMLFNQMQLTYNTDCCGWSVQFRRIGVGIPDNQFRVAFAVANIGSFGTLRRQERMF